MRLFVEEMQHRGLLGGGIVPEQVSGRAAGKQARLFQGTRPQGGIERSVINQANQFRKQSGFRSHGQLSSFQINMQGIGAFSNTLTQGS